MITVNLVEKKETGFLEKFSVEGHAGYAKYGSDIVCAAVSVLTISTINVLKSQYSVEITEGDGFIYCHIKNPDLTSNLLTEVFREGIKDLSEEYNEYVKWCLYQL